MKILFIMGEHDSPKFYSLLGISEIAAEMVGQKSKEVVI